MDAPGKFSRTLRVRLQLLRPKQHPARRVLPRLQTQSVSTDGQQRALEVIGPSERVARCDRQVSEVVVDLNVGV